MLAMPPITRKRNTESPQIAKEQKNKHLRTLQRKGDIAQLLATKIPQDISQQFELMINFYIYTKWYISNCNLTAPLITHKNWGNNLLYLLMYLVFSS
jgi:hypothetical protein